MLGPCMVIPMSLAIKAMSIAFQKSDCGCPYTPIYYHSFGRSNILDQQADWQLIDFKTFTIFNKALQSQWYLPIFTQCFKMTWSTYTRPLGLVVTQSPPRPTSVRLTIKFKRLDLLTLVR